jgi:2-amino-4-hydroxy-6-hydroxymethyldihydropteridine diphosphokinase
MPRVVIGLGSNLGDRLENLRMSVRALARLSGSSVSTSPVYETEPVGPPQPRFLNAAALFEHVFERGADHESAPRALLRGLLSIERALGRVRTERWGPRIIDLDILWIDGVTCDEPQLKVPHEHLVERAFALRPLLDLCPDAVDPRTGAPFRTPGADEGGMQRTALDLREAL